MSDPKAVLEQASTIAVVGMSTDPAKPGNHVPAQLRDAGFRIIPVNPTADSVLDEKAYASLDDVSEDIDVVEVFRPASEAPAIAKQAVAMGAKAVWLQQGLVSDEARDIVERAGLAYVEDRCMGVEQRRFRITKN